MDMIENLPKTSTAQPDSAQDSLAMQPADVHRQVDPEYMTEKEIADAFNVDKSTICKIADRLEIQTVEVLQPFSRKGRGVTQIKVRAFDKDSAVKVMLELAKSHNKKDNETVKSAAQNWTLDKVIEILNPWTAKVDTLLKAQQEQIATQQEQIAALQGQNAALTTRNTELTTNVIQLARDLSTVSLLTACKHKGQIRTQLNRVEYDTDALLQELRERLANG